MNAQHLVDAVHQAMIGIHLEARSLQRLQRFGVAVENGLAVGQQDRRRRNRAGALAVIFGSSCRTVPAVALRGLANFASPFCSCSSFMRSKDVVGISSSPRTSKSSGRPAFFSVLLRNVQRNAANGAHIRGYVLARGAVAARDAQRQRSCFEAQGHATCRRASARKRSPPWSRR